MGEVLLFLRQNENFIYLLLGAIGLYCFIRLGFAWKDWKKASFGLEREMVQRRIGSFLAVLVVCFLFAISEFVMVSFIAPGVADVSFLPTPTINLMVTQTPRMEKPTALVPIWELPLTLPTPTKDINSNGCVEQQLEWIYPRSGDEVKGSVVLEGTVNFQNLGYYKYEYSEVGSGIWNPIAAGDSRIVEGALGGPWNTAQLRPGDYRLRIVATDNNDNPYPACEISIKILMDE